jgi:hypothetical protein
VNARKGNRRWLTMLAALVAIAMLGNIVGLVIHYGARDLIRNLSASSQIIQ